MTPTQGSLYLQLHRLMDDLGFRFHDCTGPGKPLGGVCLVPTTPGGEYPEGIVVCWTPHDRLGRDADGPDPTRDRLYHTLQEVMNDDLAFLLETAGCTLQPSARPAPLSSPPPPRRRARASRGRPRPLTADPAAARPAPALGRRSPPQEPRMLRTPPHPADQADRTERLLATVRVALVAALTALVLAITALAYVVSFEAIRAFAIETAAFPPSLAWSAPLLVDSFTTAASLVILWRYLRGEGWRAPWYAWSLVGCATVVSVALNVAHAPERLAAQLFAALPPVALLGHWTC